MISCHSTESAGRPVRVKQWDKQKYTHAMGAVGDDCAFNPSTSIRLITQNTNG